MGLYADTKHEFDAILSPQFAVWRTNMSCVEDPLGGLIVTIGTTTLATRITMGDDQGQCDERTALLIVSQSALIGPRSTECHRFIWLVPLRDFDAGPQEMRYGSMIWRGLTGLGFVNLDLHSQVLDEDGIDRRNEEQNE